MQDDEAFDRGIEIAQWTGLPFYVQDGDCKYDETGRYPDVPEGCRERRRAEHTARWEAAQRKRWCGEGVV